MFIFYCKQIFLPRINKEIIIIQTNFRKKRDNELNVDRRIMKERETPAIIYSTLKLYRTIRSKTLINSLGLCLSCDRVLEITKELSDIQIKYYMKTNVQVL